MTGQASDTPRMKTLKYSENLRRMIMEINQHNFACSFKQTFEQHSVRSLIDCEDDFDVFQTNTQSGQSVGVINGRTGESISGIKTSLLSGYSCHSQSDSCIDDVIKTCIATPCPEGVSCGRDIPFLNKILRNRPVCRHHELCNHTALDRHASGSYHYLAPHSRPLPSNRHTNTYEMKSEEERNCEDKQAFTSMSEFYTLIATRPLDHLDNKEIAGWRACKKIHIADLEYNLLQVSSEVPVPAQPRKLSTRFNTSDRIPFGPSPFVSRSPVNSAPSSLSGRGGGQRSEARRHVKSAKNRTNKENSEKAHSSYRMNIKEGTPRTKLVVNMVDSPIVYNFDHHKSHRRYIQQYRDEYTKKKLQHVLLQCAQRYYSNKEGLVPLPVSRAAVECSDVREGACIQPDALKYKFEVCQKFRTHSAVKSAKQKRSNSSLATSPCRPHSEEPDGSAIIPLTLVGQQPFKSQEQVDRKKEGEGREGESRCESVNAEREGGKGGGRKDTVLRQLLGQSGSSTSVCRSRPTIPSNSRGIVCATSVETPLHIINKPYLKCSSVKGKALLNVAVSALNKKKA